MHRHHDNHDHHDVYDHDHGLALVQLTSSSAGLPARLAYGPVENLVRAAEKQWVELLDENLAPAQRDAFWRFSRDADPDRDTLQGWKLHLSATVLSAPEMVRRAAPVLGRARALWKAPTSLRGVQQLNAGLLDGYPQIGKVVTVYPGTDDLARELAAALDVALRGLTGPTRALRPAVAAG